MPWGEASAKGEKGIPAIKYGRKNLRSAGQRRGLQGLRSGPQVLRSGGQNRGRETSGVAENPGGGRHGVGRGVESPQGADTPGVAEVPWGGETSRRTTATESGLKVDGRGRGGDEKPPTARATRMQEADGSEGNSMGGLRTAGPPGTQQDTAADDGSAGLLQRQSDGADSARSKNAMRPRRKYNLLASETTEGGRANAGDSGSETGHGATEE